MPTTPGQPNGLISPVPSLEDAIVCGPCIAACGAVAVRAAGTVSSTRFDLGVPNPPPLGRRSPAWNSCSCVRFAFVPRWLVNDPAATPRAGGAEGHLCRRMLPSYLIRADKGIARSVELRPKHRTGPQGPSCFVARGPSLRRRVSAAYFKLCSPRSSDTLEASRYSVRIRRGLRASFTISIRTRLGGWWHLWSSLSAAMPPPERVGMTGGHSAGFMATFL